MSSLGICYCLEGTPEHLRDEGSAQQYCQRAEEIAELWSAASNANEAPEEAQVLVRFISLLSIQFFVQLPVMFKRKAKSKQRVEVEGRQQDL